MPSPLDTYLAQVAAHLTALPVKRRSEELVEIRQHLLNAVAINKELGQSAEDAAANAVIQFGDPADLGGNLVWAWRRERKRDKQSLAGATVTTLLVICGLFFLMDQRWFDLFLDRIMSHAFLTYLGRHPGYGRDFTQALFLTTFGLSGLLGGILFPKRAVFGVCIGLTLFWIGWAADCGSLSRALFSVDRAAWVLTAIVSAWLGSRLRLQGAKRSRHAVRV